MTSNSCPQNIWNHTSGCTCTSNGSVTAEADVSLDRLLNHEPERLSPTDRFLAQKAAERQRAFLADVREYAKTYRTAATFRDADYIGSANLSYTAHQVVEETQTAADVYAIEEASNFLDENPGDVEARDTCAAIIRRYAKALDAKPAAAPAFCIRCEGDGVVAKTSAHEPGGYAACPDCRQPAAPEFSTTWPRLASNDRQYGTVRTTNGGEVSGFLTSHGSTYGVDVETDTGHLVGITGWRVAAVRLDEAPDAT